jgi:hypothetical protein
MTLSTPQAMGRFEFLRKLAEMFATVCLSAVPVTPVNSVSPVSLTPLNNLKGEYLSEFSEKI